MENDTQNIGVKRGENLKPWSSKEIMKTMRIIKINVIKKKEGMIKKRKNQLD